MHYTDEEFNQQIKRMKKIGINTTGQTFEQMVNTALTLLEYHSIKL